MSTAVSRINRSIRTISLLDGATIAFQEWGNVLSPKKVLASHGWLDNSSSFSKMGNYLGGLGYHVIAYDIAGHGLSSHFAKGTMYLFQKYEFVLSHYVLYLYYVQKCFPLERYCPSSKRR